MPSFKTACFKLHNLSSKKRNLIDNCMDVYTSEMADILPVLEDSEEVNKKYINTLLRPDLSKCLHSSMRSEVIDDISAMYKSYTALVKDDDRTGFPVVYSEDTLPSSPDEWIEWLYAARNDEEQHEAESKIKRVFRYKPRPISISRYTITPKGWHPRGFSILRKAGTQKFYAVFFIAPVGAIRWRVNKMIDIRSNQPVMDKCANGAIIAPLAFSEQYQKECYMDVAKPKSVKIVKDQGEYFFNVAFEFETPEPKEPETYLGIDVGVYNPVAISVITPDGAVLYSKIFKQNPYIAKAKICQKIRKMQKAGKTPRLKDYKNKMLESMWHRIANEILDIATKYKSLIVVENLDGKFQTRGKYGTTCYRKLINLLKYKAPSQHRYPLRLAINNKTTLEQRRDRDGNLMWFDIYVKEVWQSYTSRNCHLCGKPGKRGKGIERVHFRCEHCGYQGDADINASINIGRRALYKKAEWECLQEFEQSFSKFKNGQRFLL